MIPMLIIVLGAPCTGKTTLGRHIARQFHLPFFHKDGLKETLFDTLGCRTRRQSRRLGLASVMLLHHIARAELVAGRSCVLESNFRPQWATDEFRALQEQHPFVPFQVYCTADPAVRAARMGKRWSSGKRHRGHGDGGAETWWARVRGLAPSQSDEGYGLLDIGGQTIEVDTTDWAAVGYEHLFEAIGIERRRCGNGLHA